MCSFKKTLTWKKGLRLTCRIWNKRPANEISRQWDIRQRCADLFVKSNVWPLDLGKDATSFQSGPISFCQAVAQEDRE